MRSGLIARPLFRKSLKSKKLLRLASDFPCAMRHVFHYVILVLVVGLVALFWARRGQLFPTPLTDLALVYEDTTTPEFLQRCGPTAPDRRSVSLTVVASPDKREWLEPAAARFGHLCPNIQVKLTMRGSFDAVDDIAKGRLRPVLWTPSSTTALRYLEHRWGQRGGRSPYANQEPISLVRSPIIWMMPDERYRVLNKILSSAPSGEGLWMQVACAMVARASATKADPHDPTEIDNLLPGFWADWYASTLAALPPLRIPTKVPPAPDPLLGQLRSWGRVKLGRPNPMTSTLGFDALYLMSYDYLVPPKQRLAAESDPGGATAATAFQRALARDSKPLRDWFRRCEAGVKELRDSGAETVHEFFSLGAARYDAVVAYEHVALPILEQVRRNAGEMALIRIVYPEPTLWADHPVVLRTVESGLTQAERIAAEKWIAFLRSEPLQALAVELGYRPSRPGASVHDYSSNSNLFLRLSSMGVRVHVPVHEAPPIAGESVAALIQTWAEATGRY